MTQAFRKTIFETPVDLLTAQQTLSVIDNAIRQRERLQHGLVNVAKIIKMRNDKDIFRYVTESDLINIDGAGVVYGARMLGYEVPERVAGIDLMSDVLTLCERRGYRPYFLGARQKVMQNFVDNTKKKHPALDIAGWRNGYFNESEEVEVVKQIAKANADCLFIGITTPKKERMLHQYRDEFNVPFQMGVGGSFDVLAGFTRRAPRLWQKAGCEWLFRMLQEPRRMTGRYMSTNFAFAALVVREMVSRQNQARS